MKDPTYISVFARLKKDKTIKLRYNTNRRLVHISVCSSSSYTSLSSPFRSTAPRLLLLYSAAAAIGLLLLVVVALLISIVVVTIVMQCHYPASAVVAVGQEIGRLTRVELLERIHLVLARGLQSQPHDAGHPGGANIDALALLDDPEVDGVHLTAGVGRHGRLHVAQQRPLRGPEEGMALDVARPSPRAQSAVLVLDQQFSNQTLAVAGHQQLG